MNSINNKVEDVLNHLQDSYDQLMPHKILKREYIINKTTFHPQYPIVTVFLPSRNFSTFPKSPERRIRRTKP